MRIVALVALSCLAAGAPACSSGPSKTPSNLPQVAITSPQDGVTVGPGATLVLAAEASDPLDGDLSASVSWTDDQGEWANLVGATRSVSFATAGTHRVTATAIDKDGNKAEAHITVEVVAGLPAVSITQPAGGAHFSKGTEVTFVAMATDSDGADLSSAVVWSDSAEAIALTGASIQVARSVEGTHIVTASVSGKNGTGSAQVAISIVVNEVPELEVLSPAEGTYVALNGAVSLSAQAGDAEDCGASPTPWCLSGEIQWVVTMPGGSTETYAGSSASFTAAVAGDYGITASVTDRGSPPRSASATVTVHAVKNVPPVCTIDHSMPHLWSPPWAYEKDEVSFMGQCVDDGIRQPVTWSDNGEVFSEKERTDKNAFALGAHTIELCAENTGKPDPGDPTEGCTSMVFQMLTNTAPTCAIVAPIANSTVISGSSFNVVFTATDAQDPGITATPLEYILTVNNADYQWYTGTVAQNPQTIAVRAAWDPGDPTATIYLSIADSGGLLANCSVTVNVSRDGT